MFFNVCENAIKYNHPGGEVVFTISKMGDYPTVIVEDTGIGIDVYKRQKYSRAIQQQVLQMRSKEHVISVWHLVILQTAKLKKV